MDKEPLSRRRAIGALEVKIMQDGQNVQGLGRKAPGDVIPLGEISS